MSNMKVTDFFQTIERKFEQMGPEEGSSFQVEVDGNVIEQRFLTRETADCVASYLIVPFLSEPKKPDAVFYYWTEDCSVYKPPGSEDETAVWLSKDETGYLRINSDQEMIGADYMRNRFYHCRQPQDYHDYMIHGHSMASVFGRWALRNSRILLHSACVGVDGKGVMLSALGGGGKSTLAVSCLLGGFDFVSDDFILVNQEGPMRAMSLYKVIGLNQDMAAILKPDMPVMRTEPRRGNKLYLDVSAYPVKKELPVHAIVFPNPCDADEPVIRPAERGPVLAKVMRTSAKTMFNFRDPETYRIMSSRLLSIPVYEILLTRDLGKNREALRRFIQKEL